jgi:hypothetical protein
MAPPGADASSRARDAVIEICRAFVRDDGSAVADAVRRGAPDAVLAVLRRERLGPLAHAVLRSAAVSRSVNTAVAADYYAAARRYVARAERLREALSALRDAVVPVVVLKGMALAEPLYGNPALRPMEDIDLLIAAADVERAHAALRALGYRTPPSFADDLAHRAASMFDRPDPSGGPPARLDVHWSLVDGKSSPVAARWGAGVWQRTAPAALGADRVTVLGPTDALLHACVHLTVNHGLLGLLWRLDIALMAHRWSGDVDWERVVTAAADARLGGIVFAALRCVDATLGPVIPPAVLAALRPRALRTRGLERWLLPRFAALGAIPYQDYVVPLLTMERARDVATLLFRRLGA